MPLLSKDGKLSAVLLAEQIGISAKAVEKHLSNLKSDGIIKRVGPARRHPILLHHRHEWHVAP